MFDVSGLVEKLTADLERLRDEDAEALRKERERNSWWAYLTSPISGQVNETDEQKQARIMKHLHRLASKTIKECELREQEAKFQRLWEALQGVSAKIVREKGKLAAEAQARAREKQVRMAEERMRREQQELQKLANNKRHERQKSEQGRPQQLRSEIGEMRRSDIKHRKQQKRASVASSRRCVSIWPKSRRNKLSGQRKKPANVKRHERQKSSVQERQQQQQQRRSELGGRRKSEEQHKQNRQQHQQQQRKR
ncbi:MAG: hypothetical protein M1815_001559 [Lichina confinis]|nr:MAG: hypothetical protein M1815_001559 [Lichina confinis]